MHAISLTPYSGSLFHQHKQTRSVLLGGGYLVTIASGVKGKNPLDRHSV